MRDWCMAYLEGPDPRHRAIGKFDSSHCGIAQEVLAHKTVTAVAKHDLAGLDQVCKYADNLLGSGGSDEWLYGRAGYLYFLRLLKVRFGSEPKAEERVQEVIERVIDCILDSPRPWTWHQKAYLGAAHGAIGIITQIVLSSPSRADTLESMLEELLEIQYPSGNFPSSSPVSHNDNLVQFCHGAPGFVISLVSLRPYFKNLSRQIEDAVTRARLCIWERGLLTKEPCLCHGISGNALAFESLENVKKFLYLTREEQLKKTWDVSDEKVDSLFTGGAGRAWAWAVAETGLVGTCIGYNDV